MTRVLIIEPAGNLWGSERALLDFIARMPSIEVAVCCPPHVPLISEFKKLSVHTLPYFVAGLHKKSRLGRLLGTIGVIRACFQFRPHVLYLNQGGCYRVALPAAILFNLAIIAHVRIFEDVAYFSTLHLNPRRLHGLIAISLAVARELRRHPALSAIPQHMIYDSYVPVVSAAQSTPSGMAGRVAYVGRMVPSKGPQLLIEAIHWLVEKGVDVDCLFIGDGPSDFVHRLKTAASNGAGANRIHWLGRRADVLSILATCSVAVCPSYREPLGRVVFEAWDTGAVPVVCSRSEGAAELITAAEGGILFAERTPESLGEALLVALRLPRKEAGRLTDNGRRWMAEHCNPLVYGVTIGKLLSDAAMTRGTQ